MKTAKHSYGIVPMYLRLRKLAREHGNDKLAHRAFILEIHGRETMQNFIAADNGHRFIHCTGHCDCNCRRCAPVGPISLHCRVTP